MKKFFLILLLGFAGLVAFAADDSQYAKVVNVSTNLNVRESADVQSEILAKLERDQTVEVLSAGNDDWTQIRYGSVTGYVKSSYLQEVKGNIREKSSFSFSGFWNSFKKFWDSISPKESDSVFVGVLKIVACILVGFICIGVIGLIIWAITFIAGIAMYILLIGLGGAMIIGMLCYFFSNGDSNAGFTGLQWGFWIGCVGGLLYSIRKPFEAMGQGLSGASRVFDMDNSVNETNVSSYIQINDTPHGKHYCDDDGIHLLREYDGFMEDERGNRFDYNGNKI